MKTKSLGIALIIIGVIMTVYTGFNYKTTEKIVDIGPIEISKEKNHPVQWAPIIGVVIVIAGSILVIKDGSDKAW